MTTGQLWMFAGDSITQGARHTHGARDYTQLFAEQLRYAERRHSELVVNAAVDGATLATEGARLHGWIDRLAPQRLSLMFGTNDAKAADPADFGDALGSLIEHGRRDGALVAIATPPPVRGIESTTTRSRLPEFVDRIRELAASSGAVLVDHAAAWNEVDLDRLLDDDVHPNALGHALLAQTFQSAVAPWLAVR